MACRRSENRQNRDLMRQWTGCKECDTECLEVFGLCCGIEPPRSCTPRLSKPIGGTRPVRFSQQRGTIGASRALSTIRSSSDGHMTADTYCRNGRPDLASGSDGSECERNSKGRLQRIEVRSSHLPTFLIRIICASWSHVRRVVGRVPPGFALCSDIGCVAPRLVVTHRMSLFAAV